MHGDNLRVFSPVIIIDQSLLETYIIYLVGLKNNRGTTTF